MSLSRSNNNFELYRLETFKTWPPCTRVKPTELAKSGFFYAGNSLYVICYFCGAQIFVDFTVYISVIIRRHVLISPLCEFVNNNSNNVPSGLESTLLSLNTRDVPLATTTPVVNFSSASSTNLSEDYQQREDDQSKEKKCSLQYINQLIAKIADTNRNYTRTMPAINWSSNTATVSSSSTGHVSQSVDGSVEKNTILGTTQLGRQPYSLRVTFCGSEIRGEEVDEIETNNFGLEMESSGVENETSIIASNPGAESIVHTQPMTSSFSSNAGSGSNNIMHSTTGSRFRFMPSFSDRRIDHEVTVPDNFPDNRIDHDHEMTVPDMTVPSTSTNSFMPNSPMGFKHLINLVNQSMACVDNRLLTYGNWTSVINPEDLAIAGFFYSGKYMHT